MRSAPPMPDDMEPLMAAVYDAAVGDATWRSFLQTLARYFDGEGAVMFASNARRDQVYWMEIIGYDAAVLKQYRDYYAALDPTVTRAYTHTPGRVVTIPMLIERRAFEATEFYQDFYVKAGTGHYFGSTIPIGTDDQTTLSVHRSLGRGDFTTADVGRLQSLIPHMVRAMRVNRLVSENHWRAITIRQALDQIPFGVLLLGRGMRVIEINERAEQFLTQAHGLSVFRSKLRIDAVDALRPLQRAVFECLSLVGKGLRPEPRIFRIPCGAGHLRVAVLPINASAMTAADQQRPLLAISLFDPANVPSLASGAIARYFDLTPREGEIAALLAQGLGTATIAARAGIAPETTRLHIKRVLSKLGVHRQSDVVRLLLTAPLQPWNAPGK